MWRPPVPWQDRFLAVGGYPARATRGPAAHRARHAPGHHPAMPAQGPRASISRRRRGARHPRDDAVRRLARHARRATGPADRRTIGRGVAVQQPLAGVGRRLFRRRSDRGGDRRSVWGARAASRLAHIEYAAEGNHAADQGHRRGSRRAVRARGQRAQERVGVQGDGQAHRHVIGLSHLGPQIRRRARERLRDSGDPVAEHRRGAHADDDDGGGTSSSIVRFPTCRPTTPT